jgi:ribosomal protein S10
MIDPKKFGVSFSIKQCRNFNIKSDETLNWLIHTMGFRRFRLMSYWNEIEKNPGTYDFKELDKQIEIIAKSGGTITLCLGARQPRWPENHWPDWAWNAEKTVRSEALLQFIETVVSRYKNQSAIVSWQLENEALLENFGRKPEVDRVRLNQEYTLVKKLDSKRPAIMTTSTSWGIPIRKPIPDIVGFSMYNIVHSPKGYRRSLYQPFVFRFRARLINIIHKKPCFIHELQTEPWGPDAIWKISTEEQDKSMSAEQIKKNITYALQTKLAPIDMWGAEWWYWRHVQGDDSIYNAVLESIS